MLYVRKISNFQKWGLPACKIITVWILSSTKKCCHLPTMLHVLWFVHTNSQFDLEVTVWTAFSHRHLMELTLLGTVGSWVENNLIKWHDVGELYYQCSKAVKREMTQMKQKLFLPSPAPYLQAPILLCFQWTASLWQQVTAGWWWSHPGYPNYTPTHINT